MFAKRTYFNFDYLAMHKPSLLTVDSDKKLLVAPLLIINNKLVSFKTPVTPSKLLAT